MIHWNGTYTKALEKKKGGGAGGGGNTNKLKNLSQENCQALESVKSVIVIN